VYHFFPGGKEQLGEEVIRRSGRMYLEIVAAPLLAAPDPVTAVRDAFAGAAEVLRATDYVDACPVATVALEVASTNESLRQATADVFSTWIDGGAAFFAASGTDQARARELAVVFIELLEGAFVLSRVLRSTDPLDRAGAAAAALVEAALPETKGRRPA
jgi:AcrR family transcriptional regulator